MSGPAIVAAGLSKEYRLSDRPVADTARDWLTERLRGSTTRPAGPGRGARFRALSDVNLRVERGDVVGIMGRNGAGKSTLLKILSRVTRPTAGSLSVWGRVSSLLEAGTGFHPELSGRENIYLSGAILGMSRREIRDKFDQIVEFAEIDPFLDTPVKRYSSGMYVRLGFSIAAHLEPEILVVDEVLAVGDVSFQAKCMDKMRQRAESGCTVIFVSHNLASMRALCRRGVLLSSGELVHDGPVGETIAKYLQSLDEQNVVPLRDRRDRSGTGQFRLEEVNIRWNGASNDCLATGDPVAFTMTVDRYVPRLECSMTIRDSLGAPVVSFDSKIVGDHDRMGTSATQFVCEVDALTLLPGRYRVDAGLSRDGVTHDHVEGVLMLDVVPARFQGRYSPTDREYGSTMMTHTWTTPKP